MAKFTHHDKFSKKTGVVFKEIVNRLDPVESDISVLDIPAGAGRLTDKLRKVGFRVVSADIDDHKDHYIFADMNEKLPFADEEFNACITLEGIEHVINYEGFISEISRITKRNGIVILSTPNISCFYSRLMFMCTGSFSQFWPTSGAINVNKEKVFDHGHITPLTWQKIYFHFAHYGLTLVAIRGGKFKRKILLPLYIPFLIVGILWNEYHFRIRSKGGHGDTPDDARYYLDVKKFSYSLPALFSRNIVMVLEKKARK